MARFYGVIGYATTEQTAPGVYTETIVERPYYGDVTRRVGKWEAGEGLNDDMNVANDISIIADPFAYQNFHCIRYVEWCCTKWKVRSIEVRRPRLILSIGGVYNEQYS